MPILDLAPPCSGHAAEDRDADRRPGPPCSAGGGEGHRRPGRRPRPDRRRGRRHGHRLRHAVGRRGSGRCPARARRLPGPRRQPRRPDHPSGGPARHPRRRPRCGRARLRGRARPRRPRAGRRRPPRRAGHPHRPRPAARRPILALLGVLLASADAVFASFLRVDFDPVTPAEHVAALAAGAWGAAALLRVASVTPPGRLAARPPPPDRRRGGLRRARRPVRPVHRLHRRAAHRPVRGWPAVLATAGLTYAEYARSGFFQLLAVAVITLGVLLLLRAATELASPGQRATFTAVAEMAVALTVVIVVVAVRRLNLYEDAFGLTMLRLYSELFSYWIGAVFLFLGAALAGVGHGRGWLVGAAVAAGLALLLASTSPTRRPSSPATSSPAPVRSGASTSPTSPAFPRTPSPPWPPACRDWTRPPGPTCAPGSLRGGARRRVAIPLHRLGRLEPRPRARRAGRHAHLRLRSRAATRSVATTPPTFRPRPGRRTARYQRAGPGITGASSRAIASSRRWSTW